MPLTALVLGFLLADNYHQIKANKSLHEHIQIYTCIGTGSPCFSKVINTLKHRAKTVCSNHHLLKEEEDHLSRALRRCKYPAQALNRVNIKQKNNNRTNQGSGYNRNNTGSHKKPYIVVPVLSV